MTIIRAPAVRVTAHAASGRVESTVRASAPNATDELAARVQLSVSPCHRRVRELERLGAIRGYRAIIDPAAVGLTFEALVFASLQQGDSGTVAAFEQAIASIPHVLQAQRLFGDPDYLLRIVTTDLAAYQQLYDHQLSALPGVRRLTSTIVMKDVVSHRPLPQ